MDNWDEWLLDVTFETPCFVPYERDKGTIVFGMNLVADKCPGRLTGVIHCDGQDAVEKWIEKNPNWRTEYGGHDSLAHIRSANGT